MDKKSKKRTKEDVLADIQYLVKEEGFIYTISLILLRDLFIDPSESADIDWRDRISYQEASFLVGLLIKEPLNLEIPHPDNVETQIGKTYQLFKELHDTHIQPFIKELLKNPPENPEKEFKKFFGSGESMTEPIFYGGSGAYDFQYLEFAKKRYVNDFDWLEKNKNLSIESATKIIKYLKKQSEEKKRTTKKPVTLEEFYNSSLNIFSLTKDDLLKQFTQKEIDSFLSNFSIVPGQCNKHLQIPGQYNEVISHPIIVLGDGRYFIPVGFNLPQSLYESPFYWMGKDKEYDEKSFKNQGLVAEDIVFEILEKVFGKGNVYKNVIVKESKEKTVTDIDVLAIIGNKAIIAQVKSKKLTELSRKGSEENLRSDFELAVQDAYQQGLTSRKAILNRDNYFEHNGQKINLEESINDAYILCVTLDHYPGVTHQLEIYLKKEENEPYPIALSIFDLDILAFYLKDPFEFLYYVRQRIDLSDYYSASSEVAFLGMHLNQKLFRNTEYDRGAIDDGFAQLVDANFPAVMGHEPKTKAIERLHHKWKNSEFDRLVNKIKESKEPGFTDAIFLLYDLSGDSADNLIKHIKIAKSKGIADKKQHDLTIIHDNGKSGVSFMYFPNPNDERISDRFKLHAMARKYKTKADIWLALGSVAGSKEIIDIVGFNREPWTEDKELEEVTKIALKEGTPIDINTSKRPGRNDKCLCGSGKKYKRCHGA